MNTLRKAHMNESCEILKFYQKIISDIKAANSCQNGANHILIWNILKIQF